MKRTIQKVLGELKQDKPDLSYIRGLLEGLVDEDVEESKDPKTRILKEVDSILKTPIKSDEEIVPGFAKPGPVAKLT